MTLNSGAVTGPFSFDLHALNDRVEMTIAKQRNQLKYFSFIKDGLILLMLKNNKIYLPGKTKQKNTSITLGK